MKILFLKCWWKQKITPYIMRLLFIFIECLSTHNGFLVYKYPTHEKKRKNIHNSISHYCKMKKKYAVL